MAIMEPAHRQNAAQAAQEINDLLVEVRRALRAANTSLATAFAAARRRGDLVETARAAQTPLALAERLAEWADLTIVTPTNSMTVPVNEAHRRADAQAQRIPLHEVETGAPDHPGRVAGNRIIHYAHVRGIDLPALVKEIGVMGVNPGLVELHRYAAALDVPLAYLVGGRVDDEPMPV